MRSIQCPQRDNCKFRAFMKISTFSLFLLALVLGVSGAPARAEKADRSKPMNIEADALRYDDVRQVSVFTGRVQLTKGSIVIHGTQLEVREDPDGYQFGRVTGTVAQPAFYRQKREAEEEFIEGEAETITYDGKADTVTFTSKAQLRRFRGSVLADEITGGVIVYANLTDMFTVDGNAGTPGAATGGRVHVTLRPKPEHASSAPVPPAAHPSTAAPGAAP
jgi:lipopolysaccharide export system protein LptA